MTTARQKVLAHLKKSRPASAREIARALKMSPPNVRHHLRVLASDGRVEMTSFRPRGGRGRPEKIYSLSYSALGDNLAVLSDVLLGEEINIESVGRRMAESTELKAMAGQPMAKVLTQLVEKLNEMKYQARWEAGAEGPRILFARCPYAKVIEAHPELCKIDKAMLGAALARSVTASAKGEAGLRGSCPFVFRVG